ncbi:hypothetical protein V2I01_07620 [Micromonospora sp. BRA006-A]|nr:hypothetical protein [Micromonospora sp. BRA006-A]
MWGAEGTCGTRTASTTSTAARPGGPSGTATRWPATRPRPRISCRRRTPSCRQRAKLAGHPAPEAWLRW